MKLSRNFIKVEGIVQGVGFRPFVYNLAEKYNLKGWVNNSTEGVFIDVEGGENQLKSMINDLQQQAPPLAVVKNISLEELPLKHYKNFTIEESTINPTGITMISPDVAICSNCELEIKDENNQRYGYPFTNCTNCGPRFSIIKELPYDRPMTTMGEFTMCKECKEEYRNPKDRRFHAQPNACPKCGPQVWLTNALGEKINTIDAIEETKGLLKRGKIVAVKGLGGFHLVCDGRNEEVIEELRRRKGRKAKPLALMMRDIETVKKYCLLNEIEESILTCIEKPILLLDRKNDNKDNTLYKNRYEIKYSNKNSKLPLNIAPNLNTIGLMLPYTPLHHLLFDDELKILVMTSANVSGLPIEYRNNEALKNLSGIVDYFLFHNREIHIPIDDSVVRVVLGKARMIRRARGYAPKPLQINGLKETLAYGAEMKNTFSISKKEYVFTSQYIGDLDNLETLQHLEKSIEHYKNLYQIEPKVIAYDMHPNYKTSKLVENQMNHLIQDVRKLEVEEVQHHHAHIVSCMVDNDINEKVIGIAFDGTGYGTDGKVWGGEFLICDFKDFKRVGHLNYLKMAGGDVAVKEPWRIGVAYLYKLMGEKLLTTNIKHLSSFKVALVVQALKNNINCFETSSMGRFFDGVSALLGVCSINSYEGQAAVELENIAKKDTKEGYNYTIKEVDGLNVVVTDSIIEGILKDLENGILTSIIAGKFHRTIINFTVEMCEGIKSKYKINKIALSGGVFHNEILLKGIHCDLENKGFEVYIHKDFPTNDGGISLGQMVIANNRGRK